MVQKCDNCRFSNRNEQQEKWGAGPWTNSVRWFCRRYPPKTGAQGTTAYPVISPADWCGEWQEKIGEPDDPKHVQS